MSTLSQFKKWLIGWVLNRVGVDAGDLPLTENDKMQYSVVHRCAYQNHAIQWNSMQYNNNNNLVFFPFCSGFIPSICFQTHAPFLFWLTACCFILKVLIKLPAYSGEHIVDYLVKLVSVMTTVKKYWQICINKYFHHKLTTAWQFPRDKAPWYFSGWNQDHWDHHLFSSTCQEWLGG